MSWNLSGNDRLGIVPITVTVVTIACSFTVPALWLGLRRFVLARETGVLDLPLIKERPEGSKIKGTAVVCGGSIVGLMTARICHDHFERVVIVEPEEWLVTEDARLADSRTQKNTRSRIMQYKSLHGNFSFVYVALKKLFPRIEEECKSSGIRISAADFKPRFWGVPCIVPYADFNGDLPPTMWASRRATETLIRRLTLNEKDFPNIEQIVGTVIGVERDPARSGYLSKVNVRTKDGAVDLDAALVVDCTGPSQSGIKWLKRAGFAQKSLYEDSANNTSRLDGDARYSSFAFHVPPSMAMNMIPIPGGWDANPGALYMCLPDPLEEHRFISALRNEGDTLVVCCGSWGPADLPDTVDGIIAHARSMVLKEPIPAWFYAMLVVCKEVEDTMQQTYARCPASYWTHFEGMQDLPSNWVAVGDSVSRLNPVLGSGCLKGQLGCLALNTLLSKTTGSESKTIPADFAKRFFMAQAQKINGMWLANKAVDYAYDTTTPEAGETLESNTFIRWYLRRLQILSATDKRIGYLLWNTQMLYGASIDLVHPVILGKVLFSVLANLYA